jgi:uncharacterized protein YukE
VADLLPLLPYDTGAMRALASDFRNKASSLNDVGSAISGAGGSMTFEGPAGDRIRQELSGCAKDTTSAAVGLAAAAGKLDSAAADVDSQNAAIARHNAKVIADMPPMERKLMENNV